MNNDTRMFTVRRDRLKKGKPYTAKNVHLTTVNKPKVKGITRIVAAEEVIDEILENSPYSGEPSLNEMVGLFKRVYRWGAAAIMARASQLLLITHTVDNMIIFRNKSTGARDIRGDITFNADGVDMLMTAMEESGLDMLELSTTVRFMTKSRPDGDLQLTHIEAIDVCDYEHVKARAKK